MAVAEQLLDLGDVDPGVEQQRRGGRAQRGGADAREREHKDADQCAITEADDGVGVDEVEEQVGFLAREDWPPSTTCSRKVILVKILLTNHVPRPIPGRQVQRSGDTLPVRADLQERREAIGD